ncbi:hypothetical protein ES703_102488 [subsurface metagenome]
MGRRNKNAGTGIAMGSVSPIYSLQQHVGQVAAGNK